MEKNKKDVSDEAQFLVSHSINLAASAARGWAER